MIKPRGSRKKLAKTSRRRRRRIGQAPPRGPEHRRSLPVHPTGRQRRASVPGPPPTPACLSPVSGVHYGACNVFTRRVWRSFVENKGHDQQCFPNLRIIDAKPGLLQASLKIEPYNLNRVGTAHGGLIMSLTDTLGSLAVATKGQYITGIGKSLAYTRVDFYNAQGQLAAYGHHTKYVGKSAGHQNDVKFSEDGERVIEGEDVD
ncbi:hypothetical protein C8Q79DRAFT_553116 [Trametes meyenii]|nr:hypothetical protein C8Q79DRAFT_553116 [Trametes meyenii]